MTGLAAALAAMLIAASPATDRCTRAHNVAKGSRAPCSGVIITGGVASECVKLKVSVVPRLKLKIVEVRDECEIAAISAAGRLSACSAESHRLAALLRTASTPPVRPWYESPAVVAVTSAVVGIAIGAVVAYGVMR